MRAVIFKTVNAVFKFDQKEVKEFLLQRHFGVRFYNQLISYYKFNTIAHNCINISVEKAAVRFLTH